MFRTITSTGYGPERTENHGAEKQSFRTRKTEQQDQDRIRDRKRMHCVLGQEKRGRFHS